MLGSNTGNSTGFSFGKSTNPTGFSFTTGNNTNQNQNQQFTLGQKANTGAPVANPISAILQGYKYILQDGQQQSDSVFSCVLFNYCPPDLRNDFLKDENNRELYNRYLQDNPDPDNMVPVTVYGFNGLKYRIETQRELLKSFDKTEVLQKAISQARIMMTECDRLARECDERQCKLEEHLIRILGKMESKSSKSQFVVTSEDFMETLVKLQREVSTPTTGLRNRLSTVYSALNTYGLSTPEEPFQLDNLDTVLNFLEHQEETLEKLVSMIKQTQRELQLILTDPFVHVYCQKS